MNRNILASHSYWSKNRKLRAAKKRWLHTLQFEPLESRNLLASVVTDLPDYRPGEWAQIFASDFQLGEAVKFQVLHNDGTPNTGGGHEPWTIVDGGADDFDGRVNGNIQTTWYVNPDDSANSSFELTALGLVSGLRANHYFTDATPDKISQFANQPDDYNYTGGVLNQNNSAYSEGSSMPYRYFLADAYEGASLIVQIHYHYIHGSENAQDFLTSVDATEALTESQNFGPLPNTFPGGFDLTSYQNKLTVPIPDDPAITQDDAYAGPREFILTSNYPMSLVGVTAPALSGDAEDKFVQITLTLGGNGDAVLNEPIVDFGLFFGAHLAVDVDWPGPDNGASDISGAGVHMRIQTELNGSLLSSGELTTQPSAIVATSIAWEKRRDDTQALQGGATFTITPNPLTGGGNITVVDNGVYDLDPDPGQFLFDSPLFGTYTITETVSPAGFNIDDFPSRTVTVNMDTPMPVIGNQGVIDPGNTNLSDFFNIPVPAIAINKVTSDGVSSGDGNTILSGEAISWLYYVTNPGITPLSGVNVVDSNAAVDPVYSSGDSNVNNLIDPGETWLFSASGTAIPGSYSNTGTATGTYLDSSGTPRTATASDSSSYFGANPLIAVNKVTVDDGSEGDGRGILSGEPISWKYTVSNTGNVALSNVTVSDSVGGVTPVYSSGDTNGDGKLDTGETWVYSASGIAGIGSYSNTGTTSGAYTDTAGHVGVATASDGSSYLGANPQIDIDKVTVDGGSSGDGRNILFNETIVWRYTVTNPGNVPLAGVVVTDSHAGVTPAYQSGDTANLGKLDPGETWVYIASGAAVSGSYANTATATGAYADAAGHVGTATDTDTSSYFGADPRIAIAKVTVDGGVKGDGLRILSGESISWQYTVTNAGNIALSNVAVTDSASGVTPAFVSGDANGDGKLDTTETWIFSAGGTAVVGSYSNTGTASGTFTDAAGHGRTPTATDGSSYFGYDPRIKILKVTHFDGASGDNLIVTVGAPIWWTYEVTAGTGNAPLSGVTVVDDNGTPGVPGDDFSPIYQSGDTSGDGKLDPGEKWTYRADGTAKSGTYANRGTASGSYTDSASHTLTVSSFDDSGYLGGTATISIQKNTVDGSTQGDGLSILTGEPIKWSYRVRNLGSLSIENVAVTDDHAVSIAYVSGDDGDGLLQPTETWIYEASGNAITGDYSNQATVTGTYDVSGSTIDVSANDTSSYFGADPQIAVVKVVKDGSTSGDGLKILGGEAIQWEYRVSNVGNVPLKNVVVTDSQPGLAIGYVSGDANGNGLLESSEVWLYQAAGMAVTGDYSNTGTASGTFSDSAGHNRTDTATDSSSYFGANPGIALVKVVKDAGTSGDGLNILTGELVMWQYTVTNSGNVALANIKLNDIPLGPITGFTGDANSNDLLDTGEVWVFSYAGTAIGDLHSNIATVSGEYRDSANHLSSPSATDASSYFGADPNIAINKVTIHGAASGDGINVLNGESVTWQYTVTNTGNVTLSNVIVTDNVAGVTPILTSGDTNSNGKFETTETWIYTASGTATKGNYTNAGTVVADYTDTAGHVRSLNISDGSSYYGADAQIDVTKVTVDGGSSGDGNVILINEPIRWRYTVTNPGNVALSNVTVVDSRAGVTPVYQSGDAGVIGQLEPGETWIYLALGNSVIGSYTNTGTASGTFTDSAGHGVTATDSDASSYSGADPQIAISKVSYDAGYSGELVNILINETIGWRYTVTNVGNVALSNISVTDSMGVTPAYVSGDSNSNGKLDLTESWIYEATGTATTGSHVNVGTASGSYTDTAGHSRTDVATDDSVYFGADPQIMMVKVLVDGAASGDGLSILTGEPIQWQYTVTNVGNVSLSNIQLNDVPLGAITSYIGDANSNGKLDTGETWVFTASGTAIRDLQSNLGTASGEYIDNAGHLRRDSYSDGSSYVGADPKINVTKVTVDGSSEGDGRGILNGESIVWKYTVTNSGNVPLSNVTVSDNVGGVTPSLFSGDTNGDGKLDTSETWIFTASGTAGIGAYTNIGTASGIYNDTAGHPRTVTASDGSSYLGANPLIDIDKVTVDDEVAGDNIHVLYNEPILWRYTVKNPGNVPLAGVVVTDDRLGVIVVAPSGDTVNPGQLDPGETWIYLVGGTAIRGSYSNTAAVVGSYLDGAGHPKVVADVDTSSYFGADPQIAITKVTVDGPVNGDSLSILAGETISWEYTVTNVGNIALAGVTVTDNAGVTPFMVSGDTNGDGFLDLGETWLYRASSIAVVGPYNNIGTARGSYTDDDGTTRTDVASDVSSYIGFAPQIKIVKSTEHSGVSGDGITIAVGESFSWNYIVTNPGNAPLSGVVVVDDAGTPADPLDDFNPAFTGGDTNGDGKLDPGEKWTYQEFSHAEDGYYSNRGTARGSYTDSGSHTLVVGNFDDSSYFGGTASLLIVKDTMDPPAVGDGLNILVGEPIAWSYRVRNLGNLPIESVQVTDDQGVTLSGPSGDDNSDGNLDPTETWVYLATGTAVVGDYANHATVRGFFRDVGEPVFVSAVDSSSYFGADPRIGIAKFTLDAAVYSDGLQILTGEPIHWVYAVYNVGNVPLGLVTVTDSDPHVTPLFDSGDTNGNGFLDNGELWLYFADGTAVTGNYSNVGKASGTYVDTAGHIRTGTAEDASDYFGANPQIAMVKVVMDGGLSGDGLNMLVGETVTWQYTVTNVGNVPLSNIELNDVPLGWITNHTGDTDSDGELDETETWIYTTSGPAVRGLQENTGTVHGEYQDSAGHDRVTTFSDSSSYFGADPQLAINKVTVHGPASGDGLNILAGEPVSWEYTVINTGNVALSDVKVVDSVGAVTPTYQSGDTNGDGKLDLTESWLFTASGTAIVGPYSNLGIASGTYADSAEHDRTATADDPSSYLGVQLGIDIDKVAYDGPIFGDDIVVLSGEVIGWRYTVKNTGTVPLSNVVISDSVLGVVPAYLSGDTNLDSILDLSETWLFTASGNAVAGPYSNTGDAVGYFRDSAGHDHVTNDKDSSSYFGADPQIAVKKVVVDGAATGDGLNVLLGESLFWEYTVTNAGNVALANVNVVDSEAAVVPVYVNGDGNLNDKLDLGETWLFRATGVAVRGNYSNIGTASGSFTDMHNSTRLALASDGSSYFGADPQIAIDKVTVHDAASGDGLNILAGQSLIWRYSVRNVGNVALSGLAVSDSDPAVTPIFVGGDANGDGKLDVGEMWIYESPGTAITGPYANVGTASGYYDDDAGHRGPDTARDGSSYFGVDTQIAINKVTVDGLTSGDGLNILVGEPMKWRYSVTNAGNAPLEHIVVTDSRLGVNPVLVSGDVNSNNLLDLTEAWIYEASGIAGLGLYTNTGTASGSYVDAGDDRRTATASDGSSYFGANPQVAINKVTIDGAAMGDGLNILVGESITWRYTITNAGNVPVSVVSVVDSMPGVTPLYVSGDTTPNGLLDLGESWIYEAHSMAIEGNYANIGTVGGIYVDSAQDRRIDIESDGSSYYGANPQIAINKVTIDGATSGDGLSILVGEPITWQYLITNAGNVPMLIVGVTDSMPGVSPAYVSGDSLANGLVDVGETWIYEAYGTAVEGDYANTGTVYGAYSDSTQHRRLHIASDDSSYFGANPQIAVEKVTVHGVDRGDGLLIRAGESIAWEYTVTNVGNVPLSNLNLADSVAGVTPSYVSGDGNSNGKLDLTETWLYRATGVAIVGAYSNTGFVAANYTDTAGHVRFDRESDDSSYFGADPAIHIEKYTNGMDVTGPTGPLVHVGTPVYWTYAVTNVGNIALASVSVRDDHGTPSNTSDDFTPVFLGGDSNSNGKLDLTEIWTYAATGTAVLGQYNNHVTVTAVSPVAPRPPVADVSAMDESYYFGLPNVVVIAPDKEKISTPWVEIVDADSGATLNAFYAYEPSYQGGVRLATGDMDGDGFDEIIVAPGRSREPEIRVFKQDGSELDKFRTMAFPPSYVGGVEVAVGDVDGDGDLDIIAVPSGAHPEVRIFEHTSSPADPISDSPMKTFSVFPSDFIGGADVAAGDFGTFGGPGPNNPGVPDDRSEVVVVNGSGMRTTAYVFDVSGSTPVLLDTILPFASTFRGGATLDVARMDGDAIPDLIFAAGITGGSTIEVWSGATDDSPDLRLAMFTTFNDLPSRHVPIHAAAVDRTGDDIADRLAVVQGTNGSANEIRTFNPDGSTPYSLPNPHPGPWNIAAMHHPSPSLVKTNGIAPLPPTADPGVGDGGDLEAEAPVAMPWTNPANHLDVNGDGVVAPIDALLTINLLNHWVINQLIVVGASEMRLPEGGIMMPEGANPGESFFVDVSGDGIVTPLDPLLVINYLNWIVRQTKGSGESGGEAESVVAGGEVAMAAAFADPVRPSEAISSMAATQPAGVRSGVMTAAVADSPRLANTTARDQAIMEFGQGGRSLDAALNDLVDELAAAVATASERTARERLYASLA